MRRPALLIAAVSSLVLVPTTSLGQTETAGIDPGDRVRLTHVQEVLGPHSVASRGTVYGTLVELAGDTVRLEVDGVVRTYVRGDRTRLNVAARGWGYYEPSSAPVRVLHGQTVRWRAGTDSLGAPQWQTGQFAYWSEDDLVITEGADTVVAGLSDLPDLSLQREADLKWMGLLVGAGAGAIYALATFEPEYSTGPRDLSEAIGCGIVAAFVGGECVYPEWQVNSKSLSVTGHALAGAALGFLLGTTMRATRWDPLPGAELSASGTPGGAALRLRIESR